MDNKRIMQVMDDIKGLLIDLELKSPKLDIITFNMALNYVHQIEKEISADLGNQTEITKQTI